MVRLPGLRAPLSKAHFKQAADLLRHRRAPALHSLVTKHYKPGDINRKPDRYWIAYEEAFAPFRFRHINLLEIGVHLRDSSRVFRDYFPSAHMVGMDIQKRPRGYPSEAVFVQGSQDDRAALTKACEHGKFDIIIDDAAHVGRLAKASFEFLYRDHLQPGGIYVLEDTTPALTRGNWADSHPYIEPIDDGDLLPSFSFGMPALIKQLMDQMMLTGNPSRIDQHRSVAIIYKPKN